jgi:hypothetical protein
LARCGVVTAAGEQDPRAAFPWAPDLAAQFRAIRQETIPLLK